MPPATPENELRELTPSGQKPLFHDRIAWALTYLKHAGALRQPKRGVYQITSRGRTLLEDCPARVDNSVLRQFQDFRDFMARSARPKHGRRRRYIARTPGELYPDREDLARDYSPRLSNGWWVSVNYGTRQIKNRILSMAAQVAGLEYGHDLVVHL